MRTPGWEAGVVQQPAAPVMHRFRGRSSHRVGAVPHAKAAVGIAALHPVAEGIVDGVVQRASSKGRSITGTGETNIRGFGGGFELDRRRQSAGLSERSSNRSCETRIG